VIGVGYLDTSVHSTSYKEITLEAEKAHVYLASATANIKNTWAHDAQEAGKPRSLILPPSLTTRTVTT